MNRYHILIMEKIGDVICRFSETFEENRVTTKQLEMSLYICPKTNYAGYKKK